MNDLIGYLEDKKDDEIVKNIKNFLSERRLLVEKQKNRESLSATISDLIMGPPANRCMNKEQKIRYDNAMNDIFDGDVWKDEKLTESEIKKHFPV